MKKIFFWISIILSTSIINAQEVSVTTNLGNIFFNPNIGIEIPTNQKQSLTVGVYSAYLIFLDGYGIDARYRFYTNENSGFYAGPYFSYYRYKTAANTEANGIFAGLEMGYKINLSKNLDLGFGIIPIYNSTYSKLDGEDKTMDGGAFFVEVCRLSYKF